MNKLLTFLAASMLVFCQSKKEESSASTHNASQTEKAVADSPQTLLKDTISIVAVGDIMIGSKYPSISYLPKDDAAGSFNAVKDYLKGDIVFGNLEGTLIDNGYTQKCGKNASNCYAFQMPERYGKIIKDAGFMLMSIANNHAGDFGEAGRKRTAEVLDENGILYAGQIEKPYITFEKDGVKYGFCAFAPNRNMVSILNIKEAQQIVQELKSKSDIVIVSFHGGAEGAKHTRVPRKNEIFFGENRGNVYEFAHSVIDAGADIVLGHGPHITRAVELYKNKFIAYSLGNFNTYGRFNLKGVNGIAPLLDIKLNAKGDFLYAKVVSIKQTDEEGLQLDPNAGAFHQIKKLTLADFPENVLHFEENPDIIRK